MKLDTKAVMENVARISADHLEYLVDVLSAYPNNMDSSMIIQEYVIPWAYEAEEAYQKTIEERKAKCDYLDWLDAFVVAKIKELKA